MKLEKIRSNAIKAQKTLEEIKPGIKCYVVVVINNVQFMPNDLIKGSSGLLDLPKLPGIFQPKQNLEPARNAVLSIKQMEEKNEQLYTEISRKKSAAENKVWSRYEFLMLKAKQDGDTLRFSQLRDECKEKRDEACLQETHKLNKELLESQASLARNRNNFETMIEKLDFFDARYELRFESLDMDKIQKLKQYPVVLAIGKTDMSPASINVVIG
jgi:hypothetical protein